MHSSNQVVKIKNAYMCVCINSMLTFYRQEMPMLHLIYSSRFMTTWVSSTPQQPITVKQHTHTHTHTHTHRYLLSNTNTYMHKHICIHTRRIHQNGEALKKAMSPTCQWKVRVHVVNPGWLC